ncbi:MAG: peptidoglycan DD-metalloendopeptidase family protein [Bacteroidales bacterium]|jgi:murein DD-endopeptidase MepM/ murein hydrolase activator NlpD|nr:peptidoglycan DD-metalloendopeptidase family protein [Bacteroidales bacterium]
MKKRVLTIVNVILVLLLGTILVLFLKKNKPDVAEEIKEEVNLEVAIEYVYGIPVNDFELVQGKIKKNQMLGNILNDYGVSNQQIYDISMLPRDEFDVRKIKAGNTYALFLDSLGVRYFVYEKDKVGYAVIHLEDTIHVEVREKPVTVRTLEVAGKIESSMWEDLTDRGINPMLSIELSEIYQWSIDFFGLQEGDQYKVIYDESFVDTNSVGISKIHAAWFYHAGHDFWAIPFVQDSVRSFFDEEGNSLRKAFLKAPLRFSRISSRFSNSRMHPVLKIRRPHHGVDYAAPTGTPVQTVGDGQVFAKGYQRRGGGNYIKIKHNGVYSTTYMHLSKFGKGINMGTYVKQGDVIGYVGATGLATGPHLDFRFYKNGQAIDPLKVKAPPVEPILEENLVDYELVKRSMMAALAEVGSRQY